MSVPCYDVPVLMYHSIGIPNKNWKWNYLTCPFQRFEQHLRYLYNSGYTTISLQKLQGYMVYGKSIPKKSIVLTFDDGYADIWIFAYPLLKKYNMCGTVFINPDFVDKRNIKRKTYLDTDELKNSDILGFLSWAEIITMDKEGIIYSESHALTHTWYPKSNKIIDFRYPNDPYIWMTWNRNIELKPTLQIDNENLKELGEPVYEFEKSLSSPIYFPNIDLKVKLVQFVEKNGGKDFYNNPEWRKELYKISNKYADLNNNKGRFESIDEYHERVYYELFFTKETLEKKLGRKISFLCWPGGSATMEGMKIAKRIGYKFFNVARDLSIDQRRNIKNTKLGGERVSRFTPFMYWDGLENNNSSVVYGNGFWLKLRLIRYSGKYYSKYWFKIISIIVNGYYRTVCRVIRSK